MDDLWATSVWDVVTRAFPEGTHGSRIITTTEIEDVALACCSYQSRYLFKMEPLSDSHSKELFTSAVFRSRKENFLYRQIDEVSDEIIRRCEGLPQAIISISSVLANQGEANTVVNWEQIQNSLSTNTSSEEKLKQVLNFCYKCLPSYLQTCLLYLSLYPENYIFLKEDIMKQWVAERFICGPTAKGKMEVAGSYFDKLVNMGLIQHIDVDYSNEVSYYAVHHMVHDIITSKSIEENFITVLDYAKRTTRFSNKVSRLSLQFGSATYATTPASTGLSQVRSLAFIGLMSCFPSILEFKLLRFLILHIWSDQASTGFNLGVICELFLLRYVQVTCNETVHLPDQMQGLKYLETFEINARIAAIPSNIFHLESLLHLRLGGGDKLPDVTGIVKNVNLNTLPSASSRAISLDDSSSPPDSVQTIELLPPISKMPKWFKQLSNLCILKIVVRELQMNDISNLQELPALTVLSLYVQQRTSTEPISFVTGAFAALEYFEFRCDVLHLAFEQGAMPSLQRINLGFNAHRGEQYDCLLVGIEGMLSVQNITVLIGSAVGAEESDMKAAEAAVKEAVGKNHCNVSIKRADVVEHDFDPPKIHHSIRETQPSASSEQRKFKSATAVRCPREANAAAYELVEYSFTKRLTETWKGQPPGFLVDTIADEIRRSEGCTCQTSAPGENYAPAQQEPPAGDDRLVRHEAAREGALQEQGHAVADDNNKWTRPAEGVLKLNVGAAFNAEAGSGAFGVILRDSAGMLVAACSRFIPHVLNVPWMEAEALLEGLKLAEKIGYKSITAESDSEALVHGIANPSSLTRMAPGAAIIFNDCLAHLAGFSSATVVHCPQEANAAAHELVRYGFSKRLGEFRNDQPPDFLINTLADDRGHPAAGISNPIPLQHSSADNQQFDSVADS